MNRRLFVGNLPYATTERQLTVLFSECGTVEEASIPKDQGTGRSRGFGFVLRERVGENDEL